MRVCLEKTGKLIESQSGGNQLPPEQLKRLISDWYYSKYGKWYSSAKSFEELLAEFKPEVEAALWEYGQRQLDILRQNAISRGYKEADIEVKFVTDAEFQVIMDAIPAPERTPEQLNEAKIKKEMRKIAIERLQMRNELSLDYK